MEVMFFEGLFEGYSNELSWWWKSLERSQVIKVGSKDLK